jgi:hypothetical protein
LRLVPAALTIPAVLGLGALTAGAATTPDTSGCPSYNPPNALTLMSGTPQSAKLGAPFADPLQVILVNTDNCPLTTPLAGIAVTFSAPGSGPSGTFASSGANAALVGTNATGAATAPQLTANRLPGGYQLVASSDYGSVSFSLVNTASGVPATIAPNSPPRQSAIVSTSYALPLQAQVLDAGGAPVVGATVTFTLGSGGGGGGNGAGAGNPGASFTGGQSQATALTDNSGIATSPTLTANTVAGKFTAAAATAGIAEPASFQLDNLAGKPPTVKPVATPKLSATVSSRYARRLEVKLTDAAGRPLQGESVTFTLGSAGGGSGVANPGASFPGGSVQATETTDVDGVASSPRFEANATAGTFTATAAVAGVSDPVEFSLDNLAGKPPRIRPLGSKSRSATVGTRYRAPLGVKLSNAKGGPIEGETVTFTLGSSAAGGGGGAGGAGSAGATFPGGTTQATETTNAAGVATSPGFEADGTAGTFPATATVPDTNASASFQLANLTGKPPRIKPLAVRLSAVVGSRYPRPLEVKVLDPHGKPMQGQTITFTLGASAGGSGVTSAGASFAGGSTQATATTNVNGIATSPRPEANSTGGTFTATAAVAGSIATASFQLDNRAATPSTVAAGAAANESASIGARFAIPLAVTVTDRHGNPVAGALVTFTAPSRGAAGSFIGLHDHRPRTVHVRTNSSGIAVAPGFRANRTAGGYVVKATVKGAVPAAFALVNLPPGV